MSTSSLLQQHNKQRSADTVQQVIECYGGEKWVSEMNELFPPTSIGCINFGYWEYVPDSISLNMRELSQLALYKKLLEFSGVSQDSKLRILEIGCGRGHGVNLISSDGHDCYGVDLTDSQIKKCITYYPHLHSKFQQAAANKTNFQSKLFDLVISVEAAQHFHNFFSFARESFRILKTGGKIAVTTFFFPKIDSKRKIKNLIPNDISGTHHAIQIHKVREYLEKSGFRNIEIVSIGSNVFKGFCKWAEQAMSQKNHTPMWEDAYENGLIDYYMILGEKV